MVGAGGTRCRGTAGDGGVPFPTQAARCSVPPTAQNPQSGTNPAASGGEGWAGSGPHPGASSGRPWWGSQGWGGCSGGHRAGGPRWGSWGCAWLGFVPVTSRSSPRGAPGSGTARAPHPSTACVVATGHPRLPPPRPVLCQRGGGHLHRAPPSWAGPPHHPAGTAASSAGTPGDGWDPGEGVRSHGAQPSPPSLGSGRWWRRTWAASGTWSSSCGSGTAAPSPRWAPRCRRRRCHSSPCTPTPA